MADREPMLPVIGGTIVFLSVTMLAVAQPLLVYSVTLSSFGIAHVLSELRYVDRRFGRALNRGTALSIGIFLTIAVAARASGVLGLAAPRLALPVELACVVGLALVVAQGPVMRRGLATGLALVLGLATATAPFDTAVILSILHNLTPLVFLWEIAPRQHRAAVMLSAGAAFIAVPLIVATGWPRVVLEAILSLPAAADPLDAGPLASLLYVYVPAAWLHGTHAIDLFTASVVAQVAHYAAVIFVLPALLGRYDPAATGLLRWPGERLFVALLVCASAFALYRFTQGFVAARGLYGIAASLHAWVEIPLMVIALTCSRDQVVAQGPTQSVITSPIAADAALQTADSANARPAVRPAPQ